MNFILSYSVAKRNDLQRLHKLPALLKDKSECGSFTRDIKKHLLGVHYTA